MISLVTSERAVEYKPTNQCLVSAKFDPDIFDTFFEKILPYYKQCPAICLGNIHHNYSQNVSPNTHAPPTHTHTNPAGTCRLYNIASTSMQRHDV